ncbi:MAG: molybdenum cofactor guanylyltransferase [Nitrospiraceae bacterium]
MTNVTRESITGLLLAGGKSRRMGKDKRFLELGGWTLFERSRRVLEKLFSEIIVVVAETNSELPYGNHRVVSDLIPDCGSLGGLYTGLFHATSPRVFAVACDMPFLNEAVIRYMATINPSADIVMAELTDGLQPMHAVYSKRCLSFLETMASSRDLKIQRLVTISELSVHLVQEGELIRIDPQLWSFHNINHPADLERAQQLLHERQTD